MNHYARPLDTLIGQPSPIGHLIGQHGEVAIERGPNAVSDRETAMASYFDEHNCEPLDPERETRTNMLLELARWVRSARGRGESRQ